MGIEEIMKKFDRINNNIKFKAFGKVTIKDKKFLRVSRTLMLMRKLRQRIC